MKHSIKKQMIVIFISLLAFMCVAVLVCNVWLLGPYYIRNKEAKFISMYFWMRNKMTNWIHPMRRHTVNWYAWQRRIICFFWQLI